MFIFGVVILGFKMLEFRGFGFCEEKDVIVGVGVMFSFVLLKESFVVGVGVDVM